MLFFLVALMLVAGVMLFMMWRVSDRMGAVADSVAVARSSVEETKSDVEEALNRIRSSSDDHARVLQGIDAVRADLMREIGLLGAGTDQVKTAMQAIHTGMFNDPGLDVVDHSEGRASMEDRIQKEMERRRVSREHAVGIINEQEIWNR